MQEFLHLISGRGMAGRLRDLQRPFQRDGVIRAISQNLYALEVGQLCFVGGIPDFRFLYRLIHRVAGLLQLFIISGGFLRADQTFGLARFNREQHVI